MMRAEAPLRRSVRRRVLWLVATLVLLAVTACCGISIDVGWQATHPARLALDTSPASQGLAYQEIAFTSRVDALTLRGWFLPAIGTAKATIIMTHGYEENRLIRTLPGLAVAKGLVEHGFNVVMFDFRGSGTSDGRLVSVGVFEIRDLLGALDWVRARHPGKVALLGYSMGAVVAIDAAADDPDVLGVVADSPFADLKTYLEANLPKWSHLPAIPFNWLILHLLPPLTHVDVSQASPIRAEDGVYPRPILFIHSRKDPLIPYTESQKLWSRHPDRFSLWLTDKGGHIGSYGGQPDAYLQRVLGFLDALVG